MKADGGGADGPSRGCKSSAVWTSPPPTPVICCQRIRLKKLKVKESRSASGRSLYVNEGRFLEFPDAKNIRCYMLKDDRSAAAGVHRFCSSLLGTIQYWMQS